MVASTQNRDDVLMFIKTPMTPRTTTLRLSGSLRICDAIEQFKREPPKDANAARLNKQLVREMSSEYQCFVAGHENVRVDPEKTTLDAIAVPKEIRTDEGVELVRVASIEVQQYARVG